MRENTQSAIGEIEQGAIFVPQLVGRFLHQHHLDTERGHVKPLVTAALRVEFSVFWVEVRSPKRLGLLLRCEAMSFVDVDSPLITVKEDRSYRSALGVRHYLGQLHSGQPRHPASCSPRPALDAVTPFYLQEPSAARKGEQQVYWGVHVPGSERGQSVGRDRVAAMSNRYDVRGRVKPMPWRVAGYLGSPGARITSGLWKPLRAAAERATASSAPVATILTQLGSTAKATHSPGSTEV